MIPLGNNCGGIFLGFQIVLIILMVTGQDRQKKNGVSCMSVKLYTYLLLMTSMRYDTNHCTCDTYSLL